MMPVKNFGDPHPITSIEEGLINYYHAERLCGDNQWECPKCKKRVDADKGLGLSKVPYLLSVNLQRFVYDWQTESAVKLDERVEFPMELDVANFLERPAPAPEGAAGGAEPVSEEGKGPAHTDFGKEREDGSRSSVLMRGRSAVGLLTPGALPYDLYAILIHSGTVAAGHYYAYVMDFASGDWFEFNDSKVTGPLDIAQVERARCRACGRPSCRQSRRRSRTARL